MGYTNTFKGNCHCGNIDFALHTNHEEQELTPRTCQCSLCKKHGASWISDPEGEAHLKIEDKNLAHYYRFGHSTSDFIICKKCGVLTIAICKVEGTTKAVLNITPMTEETFTAKPINTNFDGENTEDRLGRRNKNWTGTVIIN